MNLKRFRSTSEAIENGPKVYLIGSLRNPNIPQIANRLRKDAGARVFDDWFAAGPEADDEWKRYEQARGRPYVDAICGAHAWNVFEFDYEHLREADAVVLAMPAGKSGFMELGWALGREKPGAILLAPGEDRWDVMFRFADLITEDFDEIVAWLGAET